MWLNMARIIFKWNVRTSEHFLMLGSHPLPTRGLTGGAVCCEIHHMSCGYRKPSQAAPTGASRAQRFILGNSFLPYAITFCRNKYQCNKILQPAKNGLCPMAYRTLSIALIETIILLFYIVLNKTNFCFLILTALTGDERRKVLGRDGPVAG